MQEVWKDVKGYEGLYKVSNLGRILSLNYDNEKRAQMLKPYKVHKGYLHIDLWKNKKSKSYTVHRIVATAFIDNPNNLPQINHIDENKTNNSVGNLEWCDNRYNCTYKDRAIRIGAKLSKPVLQFDKQGNFIKKWESGIEAQRVLNIKHISECCQKKRQTAGGFIWTYER